MKTTPLDKTVNHLFRNESGKMVSVLIKIFGSAHWQLAEDVVQDALITAMENWKYKGIPDNPRAWLYRTAKNKAIDIIRREKRKRIFDFSDPEHQLLNSEYTLTSTMNNFWTEKQIHDDLLSMMYACCHPDISRENQVVFILKTLCGFSIKEIARAFLSNEETISKRIYRTKEYFRINKIKLKMPSQNLLAARTNAVLKTIYLMFNEGYKATHTKNLIREDIMEQALFLCKALTENEQTRLPEVYALMALICFHAARNDSRINDQGELIILEKQDRSLWNKELIQLGNHYLSRSAFGNTITTFHLEAAIAYEHCLARSYNETNWQAILKYYNMLADISSDPVILLNRCIVIMKIKGAQEALATLHKIPDKKKLHTYYLYYAIQGELYRQLGNNDEAVTSLLTAQELTHSQQEKIFIQKKITSIQSAGN